MPSIEEIRLALGKMYKSSEDPSRESSNINESVNSNPFSEKLFAPIEKLQREIRDKDKIIESLKNESTELTNQVSIVEKEKSTILKELKKSRWLESKVVLATKKVYEDKVKSVINENVDSKIIPVLTAVARKKQGNQQLTWGGWLEIPENRYLYQVNKSIAEKIFEDTNDLIGLRNRKRTKGGSSQTIFNNYSLTYKRTSNSTGEYVSTNFNPDDYDLNLGFTVSYWVRPDEVGTNRFAFGRKHSGTQRFVFGISQPNKIYIGVGAVKMTGTWGGNLDDNPSGLTAAELFPDLFTTPHNSNSDLIPGTWMHFAVTYQGHYEGRARKVYLNGELIQEANINWSATGGGTGGMYFGARNNVGSYNYGWSCGLDEVAIFGEEKDSDWVTGTYNGGTPTDLQNESGLVGYWRFEEGSGTTVADLSGNGNHGTLTTVDTGLPTWSNDTP